MAKISLAVYFIRLNNPNKPMLYDLGNLRGKPLTDFVHGDFKRHISSYEDDIQQEKVFKATVCEKGTAKISGKTLFYYSHVVVKSGAYGEESEIIDASTGELDFTKTLNHAEVMPFNFAVYAFPGKENGILILQSYGVYGITVLVRRLLEGIIKREIDKDTNLVLTNIAPGEYFRRLFEKGRLKAVRLFQYKPKKDKANLLSLQPFDSEYVEEVYHNPQRLNPNSITRIIEGFLRRSKVNDLMGIEGQEYDNVKLEFKIGSSSKIVNYEGFSNLVISEDVTKQTSPNGGHPEFAVIKPIMQEMAIGYAKDTRLLAPIDGETVYYEKEDFHREKAEKETGEAATVGVG